MLDSVSDVRRLRVALQVAKRDGSVIVIMSREVDTANAEAARGQLREWCRNQLDAARRDGAQVVVVDWTSARLLTMAGVAVLDDFRQRLSEAGMPVRLAINGHLPYKVLQIVGMDGVLPVCDSVEQALVGRALSARHMVNPSSNTRRARGCMHLHIQRRIRGQRRGSRRHARNPMGRPTRPAPHNRPGA